MDQQRITELLEAIRAGHVPVEEGVRVLQGLGTEDLGFARLDHHRALRCGFPEIVFGQGKTLDELRVITRSMMERHGRVLVTRVEATIGSELVRDLPAGQFHERGRIALARRDDVPATQSLGHAAIVSAGTADLAVAEEARITAEWMGCEVTTHYDCGVAGLHRLLGQLEDLRRARVLIAVAGMEGALPSVLGGLVDRPVIAVPTSVGYGASFQGLAPLLTMLNSCAAGVSVVNIDNGFGAGYLAAQILRVAERTR